VTVNTPVYLQPRDLRALRFCNRGAREFFARYGLAWSSFIKGEFDVAILERLGDPMGLRAASAARKRAAEEGARGK
jgi:hypothetical protein